VKKFFNFLTEPGFFSIIDPSMRVKSSIFYKGRRIVYYFN